MNALLHNFPTLRCNICGKDARGKMANYLAFLLIIAILLLVQSGTCDALEFLISSHFCKDIAVHEKRRKILEDVLLRLPPW